MENTVIEQEAEIIEDTTEEATAETVDNMTESELDELFSKPAEEEPEKTQIEEPNIDELYTAQMSDADAKLDKPILLKVNGQVIEVDNINDLKNMAEMGTGAQQKFKDIAGFKETQQFMEANGISKEDLQALIASKGQQEVTVDTDATAVDQIATQILNSSYADDFKGSMSQMPEHVKTEISSNPQLLQGLGIDFESGLAQTIMPHISREMATKNLDFVKAYVSVGKRLADTQETTEKQKTMLKAKPTVTQGVPSSNKDVWDMDKGEFDKYFDSI